MDILTRQLGLAEYQPVLEAMRAFLEDWSEQTTAFALFVFNLLPALPLDGGRVLRAVIWATGQDLDEAGRLTAFVGRMVTPPARSRARSPLTGTESRPLGRL